MGGRCKDSDRGRDNTNKAFTAATGYWKDYLTDSAKFSSGAEEFARVKWRQENQSWSSSLQTKYRQLIHIDFKME